MTASPWGSSAGEAVAPADLDAHLRERVGEQRLEPALRQRQQEREAIVARAAALACRGSSPASSVSDSSLLALRDRLRADAELVEQAERARVKRERVAVPRLAPLLVDHLDREPGLRERQRGHEPGRSRAYDEHVGLSSS